jgi:tryptophan synthase alpha chain
MSPAARTPGARAARLRSGSERIADLFINARREDRSVFLPFLTAGLPDPVSSSQMFESMAEAGADGFEVGIPYSDPLMDGPVICRGSEQAIAAGATLDRSLSILGDVADSTGLPSLAMTYANPVFRRGADWFCDRLAEAGAAGMIVPDLPFDEAQPLSEAAHRYGLGMVLFVALTSTYDRIKAVADASPAFIYAVAHLGVTGERSEWSNRVEELVGRIRDVTDIPVVLGVGISNPEQAATAAALADGFIVGTALVRRVLESSGPEEAAESLATVVREMSAASKR